MEKEIIEFTDGFKFEKVSKDYALNNWHKEEIFGINTSEESEGLIDSKDDIESYEEYGKELGYNDIGEDDDIEITKEDVYRVANDLSIGITDEQVKQVLELYPIEAKEDTTATWNLIVENLIYNLKTK